MCYNELRQGQMVRKTRGGKPQPGRAPADTTKALVDALNVEHADLFVTSGHASERNWQIGYSYRNGQFLCQHGQLFGVDTRGQRFPVRSENPKVYLAVGNCLMGHVDGPEAMALAWMNSAGVDQMAGYTVTSWYGYAGWGLLDYFVEQPGRFTLAEAFFANQQALLHRLKTYFPGIGEFPGADKEESAGPAALSARARQAGLTLSDFQGLFHDRDTLAFYGDPAWEVRMAPGPLAWEQSLVEKDGQYRFEIRPRQGGAILHATQHQRIATRRTADRATVPPADPGRKRADPRRGRVGARGDRQLPPGAAAQSSRSQANLPRRVPSSIGLMGFAIKTGR